MLGGHGVRLGTQQRFNTATLIQVTGLPGDQLGAIISLALDRKTTSGREIDVEVTLAVVTLALCLRAGGETSSLACAQYPLINAALFYLASDPSLWDLPADDHAKAEFHELFSEAHGTGVRRRQIQSLLGIQEKRAHRFLVREPARPWLAIDDLPERITSRQVPNINIYDAEAVAEFLIRSANGPFFFWRPK